jgi:D-alanyl-D-alanine carboxypeptidase
VTGRPLAAEFDRRVFQPLGMKDSYLTSRPPQSIRGPHGHGYYPHPDGTLRDMDRLNASYGYAAGGVISTADDISAFQRAFTQGRLLPPELQKVLNGPPQGTPRPEQPARPCEGRLQVGAVKGGAPGFTSLTYGTHDGRIQFAVSVTLAVAHSDADVQPAIDEAAEAVLCPEK